MDRDSTRPRRPCDDDLDGCCDGDVIARRAELRVIDRAVPSKAASDRDALATLGDETRYRIVRLLAAAEGELCVCELEPLLEVTDSAVSHALSDLAEAELVARRKAGTWRYYRLTERAEAIVETLDAIRGTRAAPATAGEVDA